MTMLKLLGNIGSHPGEAKFCSVKIENPAIQNKILRFAGARQFFEAIGFCEESGSLVFPTDGSAQAKMAYELLEGFANEAQYNHIRKERHAKARTLSCGVWAGPRRARPPTPSTTPSPSHGTEHFPSHCWDCAHTVTGRCAHACGLAANIALLANRTTPTCGCCAEGRMPAARVQQ